MISRPFFRRGSLRHQLIGVFMIVSAIVLAIASAAWLTWDYFQFRSDMRRELSIQALMVLENSTAAMSFADRATARETMQTLVRNPRVQAACLFDAAGTLFTEWRPAPDAPCPPRAPTPGATFTPNRLEVVEATEVAGRPAGSLLLRSDLNALTSRLRIQGLTTIVTIALVLLIAYALASTLQRLISEPVAALATTAREVSGKGDFSLRARPSTSDELDALVDAFNDMLDKIQQAQNERIDLLHREREANRLKDEFLMTLSHELRTPLNAILGWTKMLTSGVVPGHAAARALEKIERNAAVQARLVEDLLDVSRLTTGKLQLQKQSIDLVAVANNAIESTRPAADARHIRVETDFPRTPLTTFGDPERLQQVMWNLLSNAVKFSGDGGRVIVALARRGSFDELTVSDAGAGIDPAFLPSVFDPFRQADASTTRAYGGLGLGLSIVRRITEMHGGQVSAASAGPGLGATFTVRLPVVSADAEGAGEELRRRMQRSLTGDLDGVDVLVVDDDLDAREMLAMVLQASGASVQSASSAAEALQLAVRTPPDVLITDIAMPGQDGYMLMMRMKDLLGSDMPRVTIALTAQAGDDHRARALAAGFHRHIAKPIDPAALVKVVQELLGPPAAWRNQM